MIRLIVVVEGQTEEAFVKDLLVPHLAHHGVYASATIVGKVVALSRGHTRRGGGYFKHWLADIRRILSEDKTADLRVTTLFDIYGLPDDFPGLALHGADPDTNRRCDELNRALANTVADHRLIPYLQRHEFESLVLASLPHLAQVLDAEDDLRGLEALRLDVANLAPEDVNDGADSAPSKRLLQRIPGYSKTLHGPLAAGGAGLDTLRGACPRFDAWIRQLEALNVNK